MGKDRTGFALFLAVIFAALAPLAAIDGSGAAPLTGDFRGHVQDAQQKALPGITVTLLRAGKADSREQVSDDSGNFHFKDLEGGVYIATVAMAEYAPVTCAGVRIVAGNRRIQLTLMPASGEQPSSCQLAEEE
jgi:hypothetical protein